MSGNEINPEAGKDGESREQLVFTGLCLDIIILVPEIAAVILSGSATLFADAIKCANEILATSFALLIIRRVTRGGKFTYDYGMGKFETLTRIITGGVMFVSLCILIVFTVRRFLFQNVSIWMPPLSVSPSWSLPASRTHTTGRKTTGVRRRIPPHHGGPVAAPAGQDLLRRVDPPYAGTVCSPRPVQLGGVYRSGDSRLSSSGSCCSRDTGRSPPPSRISSTRPLRKSSSLSSSGN